MKDKPAIKYGREGRRLETQKNQREARSHFHPRSLARGIVHARVVKKEIFGVNKVHPGQTQSTFAKLWREEAEQFASERYA